MKRTFVIALVAAVAVAATSFAYAAIPSTEGVISACKDSKGALKVIDAEAGQTCNGNQQLLSWNQQGPAGPAGASNANYAALPVASALSNDWSTVESLSLPAGAYLVFAVGTLDDASPFSGSSCLIGPSDAPTIGGVLDHESIVVTTVDTVERFTLMAPVSWGGGPLELQCKGPDAEVWGGYLTAIKVGDLTQQ